MKGLKNLLIGVVLCLLASVLDNQLHKEETVDKEFRKYTGWLIIAALLVVMVNLLGCTQPPAKLNSSYAPGYVPLGQMGCNNVGAPFIELNPLIAERDKEWVTEHENYHVTQTKEYGGCAKMMARYTTDLDFKLKIEAEAYCAVYNQQVKSGQEPYPTMEKIVFWLLEAYRPAWNRIRVVRSLKCWSDGTYVRPPRR